MSHWRERYELLRLEHEAILRRMAELEVDQSGRFSGSRFAPQRGGYEVPNPDYPSLAEAVVAPLLGLRDEYLAAVTKIDNVVGGLEGLAAGAFREPRPVRTPAPPPEPSSNPTQQAARQKPNRMQIDVRAKGFGELLDFQERLSEMKGVVSVSVNAIDSERATLTVELQAEPEFARS